jgi:hypothetical protein
MFVVELIHHVINSWSLLQSCKSKNVLKSSWPYFVSVSKNNFYNSTQHNLTFVTKSHTNVSHACANLMNAWSAFNMGMMHINPIITSMSQRYSKFVFVSTAWFKSLFMWTTRVLYLANIYFTRDNMENHLVLTMHNNFKSLIHITWQVCHAQNVFLVKKNSMCKWFATSLQT